MRVLIHLVLTLSLLLQGLTASAATATTPEPAQSEARMPCHDEPVPERAAPCCPDAACDCAQACHGGMALPMTARTLGAVPARPLAATALVHAAAPAHRFHLLRPPIDARA